MEPVRWPLVATAIVVVLVVLLTGGVILARHARTAASQGAAVVLAPVLSTPAPVVAEPTRTTAPLRAEPTRTAAPRVEPKATQDPLRAETPGAVANTDTGNAVPPAVKTLQAGEIPIAVIDGTPQVLAAGMPTPTPQAWWAQHAPVSSTLADELGGAYQNFWNVRSQVLLDLNPTPLSDIEAGTVLQNDETALDRLRARNEPEQINVQHHIQILHATDDDAAIRDDYVSYTVPVDGQTNETLTPSPTGTWHLVYRFRKVNGTWKVVDAVQIDQ